MAKFSNGLCLIVASMKSRISPFFAPVITHISPRQKVSLAMKSTVGWMDQSKIGIFIIFTTTTQKIDNVLGDVYQYLRSFKTVGSKKNSRIRAPLCGVVE